MPTPWGREFGTAKDCATNNLTDAEFDALLSAMGPLFDELILRREACRSITGDSNIILIDRHRASLADA